MACAGPDLQLRGRVGLVELEVKIEAHVRYGDALEEVHGEGVWLRAVGLPEARGGGVAQRGHAAAGFVRGHGPGGEGRDLAEVRIRVGFARFWFILS